MSEQMERSRLLRAFTRKETVLAELLAYTEPAFVNRRFSGPVFFPLPDEPHIATWTFYLDEAEENGVFETLQEHLVQLRFPIREGISQTQDYRDATLKGSLTGGMKEATGLMLEAPQSLALSIYQSPAGKVPVLIVANESDFQALIRALSARNEPVPLPASMGAAMVSGINNWDRIRRIKAHWTASHPAGDWPAHLRQSILPHRAMYQDKLIILSEKPYSGVPASELGLSEAQWKAQSTGLRLEHECTHFFTLRYFGCMANHMHDELLADYMGISKVAGHFRPDWFLHFIGLENYPTYREGARMQNYLGKPPLSPAAFAALQELMFAATAQVACFDQALGPASTTADRTHRLLALCALTLEQMADERGAEALWAAYKSGASVKG